MDFTRTELSQVLYQWAQVFQRRSTRDFILFSKKSGLSMSQFGTLMHLHHTGGCGVSMLANRLGVTSAAASQLVDRMVHQGLLTRVEDPSDRRSKLIALTPQAAAMVQDLIKAQRRWMEDLTGSLTPDQQNAIAEALLLLTNVAEELDTENQPGSPAADPTVALC